MAKKKKNKLNRGQPSEGWTETEVNDNLKDDMEGFGGMMELADYDIVDGVIVEKSAEPTVETEPKREQEPALEKKKKKKKKKDNNAPDDNNNLSNDIVDGVIVEKIVDPTYTTDPKREQEPALEKKKKKKKKNDNNDNGVPDDNNNLSNDAPPLNKKDTALPAAAPKAEPTVETTKAAASTTPTSTTPTTENKKKKVSRKQREIAARKRKREEDKPEVNGDPTASTSTTKSTPPPTKTSKKPKKPKTKKPKPDTKKESKAVNLDRKVAIALSADKEEEVDASFDMSGWDGMGLTDTVKKALQAQKFAKPTPIQAQTIPVALIQRSDVFASAETGSGKTLAFGLPIIVQLAQSIEDGSAIPGLKALIMAPTRELALQVTDHLQRASKFCGVHAAAIVGGLALAKQTRVLASNPDIVVATPGRLWELVSGGEPFFRNLTSLKFLVVDEADRMVERGHFRELKQIIGYLTADKTDKSRKPRQNFIFSATLFNDNNSIKDDEKKNKKKSASSELEYIIELCGLRKGYKTINLSNDALASGLTIARITCTLEEKDQHLYYFLTKYPGRTLVFVNSIDCIRRVLAIFKLVGIPVLALHASMQQRQRLKNLDRFIAGENSVLIATDVAARGLDIKGIEHVVHYQLPRDSDTFVHRSGRTARGTTEGLTIALVSPEEIANYKKIIFGLNNGKDLLPFPIERTFYTGIRQRLTLADKIDMIERKHKKESANSSWLVKSAQEMDIELDDELAHQILPSEDDDEVRQTKANLKGYKAQLAQFLSAPLQQGRSSKLVVANKTMRKDRTMYAEEHGAALQIANKG